MIGPALPPGLKRSSTPSDQEDSDDDYGPALPPGFQKPVAGPSMPPATSKSPSPSQQAPEPEDDSDSDDDADVGPLPAAPGTAGPSAAEDGVQAFLDRERRQKEKEANAKNGRPERAEWMMAPPKESDLLSSMDPTKLRSRGFNSAADANRKKAAASDQSLWTETPAERAQRLADEASGKKRRIENAEDTSTPEEQDARRKKKKRDAAIAKDLEELNAGRSESLVDSHSKKQKQKAKEPQEDDGKAPVIWDRDSMLGSSAVMDNKKRQDMISSAKGPTGLSSRFGSSGYS